MRLTGWRFWTVSAILVAAYIVLGFFQDTNGRLITDSYKIFVVAMPCSALLFVLTYTILGLRGAAKWWRNDIGSRIVLFPLSIVVSTSTLAWAELFHGGLLNTPLPAWIYMGGFIAGTAILLWGTLLWIRAFRSGEGGEPPA